jgi:hypothetical protein
VERVRRRRRSAAGLLAVAVLVCAVRAAALVDSVNGKVGHVIIPTPGVTPTVSPDHATDVVIVGPDGGFIPAPNDSFTWDANGELSLDSRVLTPDPHQLSVDLFSHGPMIWTMESTDAPSLLTGQSFGTTGADGFDIVGFNSSREAPPGADAGDVGLSLEGRLNDTQGGQHAAAHCVFLADIDATTTTAPGRIVCTVENHAGVSQDLLLMADGHVTFPELPGCACPQTDVNGQWFCGACAPTSTAATATPTPTVTPTPTLTATPTPTVTPTVDVCSEEALCSTVVFPTSTPGPTWTPQSTPADVIHGCGDVGGCVTSTPGPTWTPQPTPSDVIHQCTDVGGCVTTTPGPTSTPFPTLTATSTVSWTATVTPTPSADVCGQEATCRTPTPTVTATPTFTWTATKTPTPTATVTPTSDVCAQEPGCATPTLTGATPTYTPPPTTTYQPTTTYKPTVTAAGTPIPVGQATNDSGSQPAYAPIDHAHGIAVPFYVPTTPTQTPTVTPTPTASPTLTLGATPTGPGATRTATPSPTPTVTVSPTPTATATPGAEFAGNIRIDGLYELVRGENAFALLQQDTYGNNAGIIIQAGGGIGIANGGPVNIKSGRGSGIGVPGAISLALMVRRETISPLVPHQGHYRVQDVCMSLPAAISLRRGEVFHSSLPVGQARAQSLALMSPGVSP